MGFKLVICPPNYQKHWPELLRREIPDIDVHLCPTVGEAMEVIGDADAAFGDIVPELLERAENLRWVACPQAGPPCRLLHPGACRQRSGRDQYPGNLQRPHQRPYHGLPAGLCPRVPGIHSAAGGRRLEAGLPDHLPARGDGGSRRSGRNRGRDGPALLRVRDDGAGRRSPADRADRWPWQSCTAPRL